MTTTAEALKAEHRPSTQRTQKLKQAYIEQKPNICVDRGILVTESYSKTEALPPVLRQAMAFDKVLSEMPIWIQDGELIVGNIASRPRGAFLFPEYDDTWLKRELDTISTRPGDPWLLTEEDRTRWKSYMDYWPGKNFAAIANALTPDEVKRAEKVTFVDNTMGKQGGIGEIVPDIKGVMSQGLNAFIAAAESQINSLDLTNPDDYTKLPFLKAVVIVDKAVIKWAERFAALARQKAADEKDGERKRELEEIAAVCDRVPANPARSFREALQVVVFIMDAVQIESNGVAIGSGRLDQHCFPYYDRDIKQGVITRARAIELLECLWLKLAESSRVANARGTRNHYGYPFWNQVTIGGQTEDGYDATNDLSYLMLDVSSNMRLHQPTLSARIHKRTPEKFLMKCCEAIKAHGGGHPALFNDDVIIPGQLAWVPGKTKEDAYNYSFIGCSEITTDGKGTAGPSYHSLSLGRLLELMMQGKDPFTGSLLTSGTGGMLEWKSFDDMMLAYHAQAKLWSRMMFMQVLPMIEAYTRYLPCPFVSSLTRDCIKRGKSFYGGGSIYGNSALFGCITGIATLANSIAAIRKLVFDDHVISVAQLKHALETNFEDNSTDPTGSQIQELCRRAPKYGNDDPYVDNIAKDCLNILLKEMWKHKSAPGQGYGATISPVVAHIVMGEICGATPDGRKAGAPLNDACSPAPGTDVNGPTAAIKSVATLEHINLVGGTIFNMKMHPAALETKAGMLKWANLIRTYFDLGGFEIQFNVVNADTLRDAQKHPEKYKDLVVRVVGYSAFFVELDKTVQDDIISRTEHGV